MKRGLTVFDLKVFAILAMTIDHIGSIFHPPFYDVFRIIGRISFPIFTFLLIEGFYHTKSIKKYLIRLFLFALISEPFYDILFHKTYFYSNAQNVFFELFFGLVMISFMTRVTSLIKKHFKGPDKILLSFSCHLLLLLLFSFLALSFHFDYHMLGIFMIDVMFLLKDHLFLIFLAIFLFTLFTTGLTIQLFAPLALVPLLFYNGALGKRTRYSFYVYYPLHLFLLSLF